MLAHPTVFMDPASQANIPATYQKACSEKTIAGACFVTMLLLSCSFLCRVPHILQDVRKGEVKGTPWRVGSSVRTVFLERNQTLAYPIGWFKGKFLTYHHHSAIWTRNFSSLGVYYFPKFHPAERDELPTTKVSLDIIDGDLPRQ